jgi:hypothetical protein
MDYELQYQTLGLSGLALYKASAMLSKHHALVSKAECLYSQVFPNATIEKLINFMI